MSRSYERTLTDALEMITHAKHNEAEVLPITQVFYYPSVSETIYFNGSMKLMDIDEDFIKKLEDGDSLIFKGELDEKLVMCTEDSTFEVKEGEISNCLVVTPDLVFSQCLKSSCIEERRVEEKKIVGIFNSYLELRPTFPKLGKLRTLLSNCYYRGPEYEDELPNSGFYMSELLDLVQCSQTELLEELRQLKASCIEDKWRMLDAEYESRMLSFVVNLVEDQSWEAVHRADALRILRPLMPHFILDHLLTHFAQPLPGDGDQYQLLAGPVCRSFAEMLLRAGEGKFRHNEFMMAWKHCLPPGMTADLTHLKGLALVEKEGMQQEVIHLFPEHSLPENVAERFRLLFKKKPKWTLEEIQPYVEKLATKSMNVSSMLTKFSRPSTLHGVRVFGARHAN